MASRRRPTPSTRRQVLKGGAAVACALAAGTAAATGSGLYVPPEETRHEATLMMWPGSPAVYDDPGFLDMTQRTIAEIANTIAAFEPVILLADAAHHARIRRLVSSSVQLWDIPTEDLWCRDAGPLFAFRGSERVVSHLQFDGWGGAQVHRLDAQVAAQVAERLGAPLVPSGVVGEPGGVEHDGHGLLLAHESSWVEPGRNPGLSRAQIEDRLLTAYGAGRMIWSPGVLNQDITDYHIDSLARFTGPGRVLINLPRYPDPAESFHRAARVTHRRLTDAGLLVDVIEEPERRRVQSPDFVASYANYYVCNDAVITAQFGDPQTDAAAVTALRRHFPGREVVALNADPLGELGGGVHCATQQIPAA
tara:strand:+ start:251 stop:1342 length:1092 start_codon:yes stop_codon:yes gene_type:complete